ncbi:Uncharacterised protein [Sphingobacterium daejeonense]|jgi:hypothetical protein|nr:Uncharacterised protein [Sphingobacterium daejeonense]
MALLIHKKSLTFGNEIVNKKKNKDSWVTI